MRCRRIRYDREDCHYHLMNRIAGEPGEFPWSCHSPAERAHCDLTVARLRFAPAQSGREGDLPAPGG